MKMFINSIGNESVDSTLIPISLNYVSTRITELGDVKGGHIQGVVIDEQNDRCFISWTSGINAYRWSDLTYLYTTGIDDINNGTGAISGTHIGDIAYKDGYVYGSNALDHFTTISPARNVIHKWDANDLSLVYSVESDFLHSVGAMSFNGKSLYAGYGNELISDGLLQKIDLTTLEKASDSIITVPYQQNTDFWNGIQSMSYFSGYLATCDYTGVTASTSTGSNLKYIDMGNRTFIKNRYNQIPYDYGVCVIGSKLYLIQKGNSGSSNVLVDVLEFNIVNKS